MCWEKAKKCSKNDKESTQIVFELSNRAQNIERNDIKKYIRKCLKICLKICANHEPIKQKQTVNTNGDKLKPKNKLVSKEEKENVGQKISAILLQHREGRCRNSKKNSSYLSKLEK